MAQVFNILVYEVDTRSIRSDTMVFVKSLSKSTSGTSNVIRGVAGTSGAPQVTTLFRLLSQALDAGQVHSMYFFSGSQKGVQFPK